MVNGSRPFTLTEQSRVNRFRGRDTLLERLRHMRPLRAMALATTMSLGVAACGHESAPPPAKASKSLGLETAAPDTSPGSPTPTEKNIGTHFSTANIRLLYEVTNVSSKARGKESQIVAISGDKLSYRTNGTGYDGKPDDSYVLLAPSGSVFCQKTCGPVPAAESTQLRKIAIPAFIAPLERSTLSVLGDDISIKPASDRTIHGIKTNCVTFSGTAIGFKVDGTSCAAVDGGYLVHLTEKTNGLAAVFDLQSVRAAVAADFPTH